MNAAMSAFQVFLLVIPVLISGASGHYAPGAVSPRSELGHALRAVGRRGQREVNAALRDGRAVDDARLAALAAALAESRMNEADHRGPVRRWEGVSVVVVAVLAGAVFALGRDWRSTGIALGVCWLLMVGWLLGLRRLIPTTRDPRADRLLMAHRANADLAAQAGPASLEHAGIGLD